MKLITAGELRTLLDYDSETGLFHWKNLSNQKDGAGKLAGSITDRGRIAITVKNRKYLAHRLAWLYVTGEYPEFHLDHKDGCPTNNKFSNLRPCSVSQNRCNGRPTTKRSSLPRGVTTSRTGNTFIARIKHQARQITLGRFPTAELASEMYELAAEMLHGEFSYHLCAGKARNQGATA